MADQIKVVVRVRPLVQRELDENKQIRWITNGASIRPSDGGNPYVFDFVYDNVPTFDLYAEVVDPIVKSTMEGFNGTVFAYGQTASGKTFTMMGDDELPGVIPIAVDHIFNTIENNPAKEYVIHVSYMEIYNENVSDLLDSPRRNLDVREDIYGNVYVNHLKDFFVTTPGEVLDLVKKGEKNRHFAATNMNEHSSRSHTIFRITIGSRKRCAERAQSDEEPVIVGHLNLVDLAGSEKASQTGATGQRLVEGANINRSLFTLSQVISQLSVNAPFINYRDSKLTRILQNALGGNSKTAIICNVTPASVEETHSTLKFATRAKKIKNKPVLNEVLTEAALVKIYKTEVEKLKSKLETMTNSDMNQENEELREKLKEMEQQQQEQEDKLHQLRQFFFSSSKSADDFKTKSKRRQTWCPGKTRMSMAPPGFKQRGLMAAELTAEQHEFKPPLPPAPFSVGRTITHRRSEQLNTSVMSCNMDETMDLLSSQNITFGTTEMAGPCLLDELASADQNTTGSSVGSNQDWEEKDREISQLRDKLRQRDTKIKELSDLLEMQNTDLDYTNEVMKAQEQEIRRMSQAPEARSACSKCEKLEQFSLSFIEDMEQAKNREDQLQKQLNTLSTLNEDLKERLKEKEQELREMEEFNSMEADLKNESLFHRQLESEVEKENEKHREKIGELEMKIAELVEENRQLLTSVGSCNHNDNNEKVEHLENGNKVTESERQNWQEERQKWETEIQEMKERCECLEQEKSALLKSHSITHEVLPPSESTPTESKGLNLEESVRMVFEEKLRNLESEKNILEAENEELKEEVEHLNEELKLHKAHHDDSSSHFKELEQIRLDRAKLHEQEKIELLKEIETLREQCKELGNNANALEATQSSLLNEKTEMQAAKDKMEAELVELKSQAAKLQDKIRELERKNKGGINIAAEISKAVEQERRRGESAMQEKLNTLRRETLAKVADDQTALLAELRKQEQENKQLAQKYQKAKNDADLAEHQLKKVGEEKEKIKSEMVTMHSLLMQHEKQAKSLESNPEKLMDRFKKMATNLDLTKQRCDNFEAQVKQNKGMADKLDDLTFQRNNLQRQLRDAEHELNKTRQDMDRFRQSAASCQVQVSQYKIQVNLLQDTLDQAKAEKERAESRLEVAERDLQQAMSKEPPKQEMSAEKLKELETAWEKKYEEKLEKEKESLTRQAASREEEFVEKSRQDEQKSRRKMEDEILQRVKEVTAVKEEKLREKMEEEKEKEMEKFAIQLEKENEQRLTEEIQRKEQSLRNEMDNRLALKDKEIARIKMEFEEKQDELLHTLEQQANCRVDEVLQERVDREMAKKEAEISERLQQEFANRLDTELSQRLEEELLRRVESETRSQCENGESKEMEIQQRVESRLAERLQAEEARITQEVEERLTIEMEARITQEVEERLTIEMEARITQEVEERLTIEMEARITQEVEERLTIEMEARITQEVEERLTIEMEARITQEVEERMTREMEARITQEVEERLTIEMEVRITQEVEERLTIEMEARITQEVEEKLTREMEGRITQEVEEKLTREMEDRLSQELEARLSRHGKDSQIILESELRKSMEKEIAERLESETLSHTEELETRIKQQVESEIKQQSESEFKKQMESEIRLQIESEVKEKLENDLRLQLEIEIKEKIEADLKQQLESEIKAALENEIKQNIGYEVRQQIEAEVRQQIEKDMKQEAEIDTKQLVESDIRKRVENELRHELESEIKNRVESEVRERENELRQEVEAEIKNRVESEVRERENELRQEVEAEIKNRVESEVRERENELRQEVEAEIRKQESEVRERTEGILRQEVETEMEARMMQELQDLKEQAFHHLSMEKEAVVKFYEVKLEDLKKQLEESKLQATETKSSQTSTDSDLCKELEAKVITLQNAISQLEQALKEALDFSEQAQMTCQRLEDENEALKECVDIASNEISELKSALQSLKEEHETTLMQLHSPRRSSGGNNSRLQDELLDAKDRIAQLTEVLKNGQAKLESVQKELKTLEERHKSVMEELGRQKQYLEAEKSESKRLYNGLEEAENEIDEKDAEIKKLKQEIIELQSQLQEAKIDGAAASADVSAGHIQAETESLRTKLANLTKLHETTQSDIAKKEQQITALREELGRQKQFVEAERRESKRLYTGLEEAEDDVDKRDAEIKSLKAEISNLQGCLQAAQVEATASSSISAKTEQLEAQVKELMKELETLGQLHQSTQQDIAKKDQQIDSLKEELGRQQQYLDTEKKECKRLYTGLEEAENEIDEKDTEIKNLKKEIVTLQGKLQDVQSVSLVSKPAGATCSNQELEKLKSELESLRKLHKRTEEALSQHKQYLEAEKSECKRLYKGLEEAENEIDEKDIQIKDLNKKISTLQGELASRSTESGCGIEALAKENAALKQAAGKHEWTICSLERELEKHKASYASLLQDRDELYESLQKHKAEIRRLNNRENESMWVASGLSEEDYKWHQMYMELERVKADKEGLEGHIEMLEKKRDEYRTIIKDLRKEIRELKEKEQPRPALATYNSPGVEKQPSISEMLAQYQKDDEPPRPQRATANENEDPNDDPNKCRTQ